MKSPGVFIGWIALLVAGMPAINLHAAESTVPAADSETATLTLDLSKPGASVSPDFHGFMTEEINHSYDGGLYAELVQNRIFKDDPKDPVHWSLVQDGGGSGTIALDKDHPVNKALTVCLKLDVTQAGKRVGVANDGYWGIPVKEATTYKASFYARVDKVGVGPLTVTIESNDGATAYAQAKVQDVTADWKQYSVTLATPKHLKPTKDARLVISTASAGTYWFNLVSLFPPTWHDRPNGNRIDLMQMMAGMKPEFLRFPGGNFLEGDWFRSRYIWKQTLGPLDQRPGHPGCWGYRASDGMGLLEFLEWCEDLKMKPVLAVFAGYVLKGDSIEPGPVLQGFVNDALDEIEYVTGDTTTKWGAERAKDGHPEPFPLTYVEIGNEDFIDHTPGGYDGRFTQFYDAIKAKYPNLQLIATTKVASRVPDIVDDHYYRSPDRMEGDATHYDNYSRTGPRIFVGEWATRTGAWNKVSGEPTPDLEWALADAAWLTGLERNSDIVIMQCYAPLFVNTNPGARQWEPNLIGYDALNSYASPSYYAQQMFSTYLGDKVVPMTGDNIPMQAKPQDKPDAAAIPSLFYVATRDAHTIYLHVVNTAAAPQKVQFDLNGIDHVVPNGLSLVLSSNNLNDANTITAPAKIMPVKSKANGLGKSFTRTLAPYSVNVLVMKTE